MGWFNKKYIHENKIFDPKLSKIYTQTMRNREKYDYNIAEYPDKNCTIMDLEDAKFFVNTVSEYIKSRIDIE